jgi:protocatechuate 3,4-dioxygenase beta subunit
MRKLTRRESLAALGTVTAGGLLAACGGDDGQTGGTTTAATTDTAASQAKTTPKATAALFDASQSCQVTAELTEGPYYIDVDKIRSDIREDREGTRLRLAFRVRDAQSCEPLDNAVVEVWHCDGLGIYSGFESASEGGPGGGSGPTDEKTYLRGAQVTNADGIVEFTTIYPGWYRGRTVHFHVKIAPSGSSVVTTQVFTTKEFDEQVYASAPYDQDTGRDTFNESDGIFQDELVLTLRKESGGVLGFTTFDVTAA